MKVIARHRDAREATAFERALFPQSGLEFETSSDVELVFDENRYTYNQPYKGGTNFKKHLFRVIGDMEPTGEEYECAVYLERSPSVKTWVRNTSRQPHSFWLQTSSDKFYSDFVAQTHDGRSLVVEYKGAPYFTNDASKEKRLIGDLWADRSAGRGVFLMIENKEFHRIERQLESLCLTRCFGSSGRCWESATSATAAKFHGAKGADRPSARPLARWLHNQDPSEDRLRRPHDRL